ncbi:MAG: 16S rRNA (cytidine(1402)-2'-O)-methyltransferase [Myxococcota bacterium]
MTVALEGGRVYVVATPIGNLEDLSPRAQRVLASVDWIACEDTRRTARLCSRFDIRTPRLSLHAHNERRRIPELVARLGAGASLALVSDAGTPLISDPGARLVEAAIEARIPVVPVPGPSAPLAALVASGLPALPFTCIGFLERRGGRRRSQLEALRQAPGTLIVFEAPGRVNATLRDLGRVLGNRRVAVARELTKRYEQIVRGRLQSLEISAERGEFTLVIAPGEPAPAAPGERELKEAIAELLDSGTTPRDAARILADRFGLARSDAYARVQAELRARRG